MTDEFDVEGVKVEEKVVDIMVAHNNFIKHTILELIDPTPRNILDIHTSGNHYLVLTPTVVLTNNLAEDETYKLHAGQIQLLADYTGGFVLLSARETSKNVQSIGLKNIIKSIKLLDPNRDDKGFGVLDVLADQFNNRNVAYYSAEKGIHKVWFGVDHPRLSYRMCLDFSDDFLKNTYLPEHAFMRSSLPLLRKTSRRNVKRMNENLNELTSNTIVSYYPQQGKTKATLEATIYSSTIPEKVDEDRLTNVNAVLAQVYESFSKKIISANQSGGRFI